MSYGTPTKPKNPPYENREEEKNQHKFTLEEIRQVLYQRKFGILFGSAAVWVYALKYGFTSEELDKMGLNGTGSDIDLIDERRDLLGETEDFYVSRDGMEYRHIDLVSAQITFGVSWEDLNEHMSHSIELRPYLFHIIKIDALIARYEYALGEQYDMHPESEEDKKKKIVKIDKIQLKLKLLSEIKKNMSARPETETGDDAPAHFKF